MTEFWTEATSISYFQSENWAEDMNNNPLEIWGGLGADHPVAKKLAIKQEIIVID